MLVSRLLENGSLGCCSARQRALAQQPAGKEIEQETTRLVSFPPGVLTCSPPALAAVWEGDVSSGAKRGCVCTAGTFLVARHEFLANS